MTGTVPDGLTTMPILIVEDDEQIRTVVAEILGDVGYRVRTAANGQEALEAVERERPALVVLDMQMPVLDGWGFAAALRERDLRIPILVITAAPSAESRAREIGAEGYLGKPFDIASLLDRVAELAGPAPA